MFLQLLFGSVAVIISIVIQGVFIAIAVTVLTKMGAWLIRGATGLKLLVALVALTLWMLAGLTAAVWIWAAIYVALGVFADFETSLYFSTVAFTTLGFGDITLDENWRLMSSLMAANGLIVFSLSTAFLIEALLRIGHAQRVADHRE